MQLFIKQLVKWSKYIAIVLLFSTSVALGAPDNPNVKRWVEDTFTSGTEIYEAFKTITFDVQYIRELNGDKWQHPKETLRLKGGDCEDAMLLFSSLIPSDLENVRIVWGYIQTLEGKVVKHVWGHVISKTGAKHVLLNAKSSGWNGLVSELHAQRILLNRYIILSITQKEFNRVTNYFKDVEEFNEEVFKEVIKLVPHSNTHKVDHYEMYYIFKSLHKVFSTKTEKS